MNDTDKKALLRRTTLLSASLAGVSFASWTTAQERDLATLELDALTVSARVWEEPVKEVPFSLSAFEEAALKDGMIDDSRDLFRATPNFNFTDTGLPEANLLNIRGIGSSSTFLSPSVTYYIDGVPVQQRAFDQRFLDTKRVEVLRGPQGTLWGQSSQAGAVSFVTENPTETVQGRIAGSLGNFDAYTLEGTLSGPIAEGVSGRINVQTHGRDGDIRNATFTSLTESVEEESLRETELLAANGKLRFETGEDTTITLSGRYVSDEQRPTTGLLVNGSDFPINSLNPIPLNELDSMGMALRVESDLGGSKFVSITGYESYDLLMEADITDGFIANASMGAPPFFVGMLNSLRVIEEDSIQWSQEARLQGESDSGSTWVVGFSALDSNFDSSTDVTSPALPNGKYAANIEKTNTAFFGEATILTSERTRFIAGARFNREKSDFSGAWSGRLPPAVDAFDEEGSVDEEFITGRLAASHDFSDELTGYATVARGEKAGGFPFFNQAAAFGVSATAFRNSSTNAYEVGLKGSALEGKASFTASLFFNDTSDEQFFIFNPLAGRFQVENADSESYGAEFEFAARLAEGFFVTGGLGFLDTKATSDSLGGSVKIGNEIPYAPEISYNFGAQYLFSASGLGLEGDFFLRGEYQGVGTRMMDPANTFELESYQLANLRFAYRAGQYELYLFGRNVFDESLVSSGFSAGFNQAEMMPVIGGVPGLPRMYGAGFEMRF